LDNYPIKIISKKNAPKAVSRYRLDIIYHEERKVMKKNNNLSPLFFMFFMTFMVKNFLG